MDWSILQDEGMETALKKAVTRVLRNYPDTMEYDDLHQEAVIILATKSDMFREVMADPELGERGVVHRLWQDVTDKIKTDGRRRSQQTSWERLLDTALVSEGA
jgi:hypothetical protein